MLIGQENAEQSISYYWVCIVEINKCSKCNNVLRKLASRIRFVVFCFLLFLFLDLDLDLDLDFWIFGFLDFLDFNFIHLS